MRNGLVFGEGEQSGERRAGGGGTGLKKARILPGDFDFLFFEGLKIVFALLIRLSLWSSVLTESVSPSFSGTSSSLLLFRLGLGLRLGAVLRGLAA